MKYILLSVLIAAVKVHAQVLPARAFDSSAVAIMRHLPPDVSPSPLIPLMRQSGRSMSRANLDELADSLVGRATSNRVPLGRHTAGYAEAVGALNTLIAAGSVTESNGQPYSGAFDRLVRIHRESRVQRIRERALDALTSTTERQAALSYLEAVASSNDSTASHAVSVLIADARGGSFQRRTSPMEREQTLSILKSLDANHRVRDRVAARELTSWLQSVKAKP